MASTTTARHGATIARAFARGLTLEAVAQSRTRVARVRGHAPSAGVPVTEADPVGADVLGDPAAWYRELHAGGPVHYAPRRDLWVVSGYDEVRAAARAHETLSSADGIARFRMPVPMLVATDRPDHARLRRILARDFTKEQMARRRTQITGIADAGIAAILAAGPGGTDAYEALAVPVPLGVIAGILGVPDEDLRELRHWTDLAVEGFAMTPGPEALATLRASVTDGSAMFRYFDAMIERRRVRPGEDALSRLATFADEEGPLSTDELLWFTLLLLVGGNETTTSLLTALLYCFARDPAQYDALRADPGRIDAAIEEGLRWATPIPAFFRTARTPYETGGVIVPAGARVMLSFAAANRDPARFADPDRFDAGRAPAEHLAFGSGIHFCLGAHLARLEARIVLERLLERVARIELTGVPVWRRNPSLRGIDALPLRFVAT